MASIGRIGACAGFDWSPVVVGGEFMDLARLEFFLDDGWNLIGRLHQWLSRLATAPADRASYLELIGRLQTFWAAADDLQLKHIPRATLCLEQVLERFCASGMQITEDRLQILTVGVQGFQELLLGFEATREEPIVFDMSDMLQLERQMLLTVPVEQPAVVASEITETPVIHAPAIPLVTVEPPVLPVSIEKNLNLKLILMLDKFATKLDEACQRLHRRMVADESPYVTTTSRLEHLSKTTRELVRKLRARTKPTARDSSKKQANATTVLESSPEALIALPVVANEHSITQLEDTRLNHETIVQIEELPASEFARPTRRILILEESLFYRHLITIALRSSGYDAVAFDSSSKGMVGLDQSNKIDAILLGSKVNEETLDAVLQYREVQGAKLIALNSADSEQFPFDVDDQVTKSHPQQLINALDRGFATSFGDLRQTA